MQQLPPFPERRRATAEPSTRNLAARAADRTRRPRRRRHGPDIDVPLAARPAPPVAGPDFAGRLGTQLGRGDDRFEIRQGRAVIMRPRGIEQDQV